MKESLWGYLILLLGVIVTTVMLLVSRVTTHAEEDYYLAREIMQASMLDSVDYGAYRTTGRIIMSKSKFMEVYIRRFAESVTNSQDYQIDFYDIYEEPPKASVRIRTMSGESTINSDSLNFSIDTLISGVLETNFEQYNAINLKEDKKYNSSIDDYAEGKSSAARYTMFSLSGGAGIAKGTKIYKLVGKNIVAPTNETMPIGKRVTLILTKKVSTLDAESKNFEADDGASEYGSCLYKTADGPEKMYCKAYYNGQIVYLYRKDLNTKSLSEYKRDGWVFDKTKYKLCEYSELKVNNSNVNSSLEYKWVKNGGALSYPSASSAKNSKTVAACTLVKVKGCDYGTKKNMCKLENGNYMNESDLKDEYECGGSSVSIPDNVTIKDLQNIGTIDEIAADVSQERYMLIVLDQNGVNDLGNPIYYYYDLKTKKMYQSYNRNSKTFSKEVKKVTMPKVNGKSCKGYIVKNGGFVINSDGSLIKDFETTLKNKYGDAIVYILYPFC